MLFKEKIVVVTGSSKGIGKMTALGFAKEGATVVINYRSDEKGAMSAVNEIKTLGSECIAIKADMSYFDDVKEMCNTIINSFGRIDILINNAGILKRSFLMMTSTEAFTEVINSNLVSCFNGIRAFSKYMVQQKSGVIVNVSSLAAFQGLRGQGAYAASKGGINSLTCVSAKEFAPFNIRINAIAPGCIDIGMLAKITAKEREQYNSVIPVKRFGEVNEVVETILFLASDKASYIYGQVIVIDGGMSLGL